MTGWDDGEVGEFVQAMAGNGCAEMEEAMWEFFADEVRAALSPPPPQGDERG